jgi:branched-chain amino acid transport system permease protein
VEIFIAQIVGGLIIGSIYALTAVGVNFLMLVAGFIQLAHGEVIAISMYCTWLALDKFNNNLALGISAAIGIAVLLTVSLEPITRRLRQRLSIVECVILAMAFGMILTEIMSHYFSHGMPVRFPESLTGGSADFVKLGLVSVSFGNLCVLVGGILSILGFSFFLYRTKLGMAMRAIVQNSNTARIIGIPIAKATFYGFAITGLLAGITAVLFAITLGFVSPSIGEVLSFRALAVMLFAGLGNLKGGIICGLLLGIVESLTTGYFWGEWSDAISMGIIMLTIMIRPDGLFGTKV